jgi:hypothetical protein
MYGIVVVEVVQQVSVSQMPPTTYKYFATAAYSRREAFSIATRNYDQSMVFCFVELVLN